MAKTLRTSGDYTIKAGDGFNSGAGTNSITLDSLNVTVNGNLTVGGTSSTISTTNTVIEDNIIELQTGISASSNDSGIIIERGSTGDNAAIVWDESVDSFKLGTTTATGADKSGGITVTAGALEVGALTATTGTFSGALTSVGFTVEGNITAGSVTTNTITSNGSNAELSLQASGTGDVVISALRVNGTTLDSADSTKITVAEDVDVTGTLFSRGNVYGVQTLTGSGSTEVINLTDTVTLLVTTGSNQNFSLANGVEGQIKIISMKTDGGDGIVTPASFVNGTSITFNDVEDTVTMLYQSTGWVLLARQNAVVG